MTQLATSDDLAYRLGRNLTNSEVDRADALLDDASAAVRSYTGQQFVTQEHEDRLPVRRNKIRLPQRPVTAVDTVEDMDGNDVAFTWDAGDTIYLTDYTGRAFQLLFAPRTTPLSFVDITYTAGYETVPEDIVAVICAIAARALGVDPTQTGVTSESLGDASISYGTIGAAGGLGLFPDERAILNRYRRVGGTVFVS